MLSVARASYPSALDIEQAAANHSYIRVTGKRNKNMSIAGIIKTFNNPETSNWIYVPSLRLMGDPNDVYNAILHLNFSGPNGEIKKYTPEQAAEFTAPGLNQNNYNRDNIEVPVAEGGMMETLDHELAETEAGRRAIRAQKQINKPSPVSLDNLPFIYEQIIGQPVPTTSTARSATSSSTPGRKKLTLADRYRQLPPGKVLDVSGYIQTTGTGARTIEAPRGNTSKVGVAGVNVVSNNASSYAAAVNDIFGPVEGARLAQEYNQLVNNRGMVRVSPARASIPAVNQARAPVQAVNQARAPLQPIGQARAPIPPINQARAPVQAVNQAGAPVQAVNQPLQQPGLTEQVPPVTQVSPRQTVQPTSTMPRRPAIPNLNRLGGGNANIPSNRNMPALTSPGAEE